MKSVMAVAISVMCNFSTTYVDSGKCTQELTQCYKHERKHLGLFRRDENRGNALSTCVSRLGVFANETPQTYKTNIDLISKHMSRRATFQDTSHFIEQNLPMKAPVDQNFKGKDD